MDKIQIEGTKITPTVLLDPQLGLIRVAGRSLSQSSIPFYEPLFKWLDEYCKNPQPKTRIELQLEYFNSTSSKLLIDFLMRITNGMPANADYTIFWMYEAEDDDLLAQGKEIESFLGVKMEFFVTS